MIAYDVERMGGYAKALSRREARIEVTSNYAESVRRFLDGIRQASTSRS